MAYKVGITGGIGSGKSVVCDIFRLLGIPVFNSDLEGRKILENDEEVIRSVTSLFGPGAYTRPHHPDRKYIASQAFSDPGKLGKLNAIIHPAVNRHFEEWCLKNASAPYIVKEAAVLVESGAYKQMDCVVLVSAPEEIRFSRAGKRDKITPEEVRKRSMNQLPEAELKKYAQYTIVNDEVQMLIPQVLKLHELFKTRKQPS